VSVGRRRAGQSATLEDCAAFSSNTCFAHLASRVLGPQKIRETAYDLGIGQNQLKERDGSVNATITLGTYNSTVMEMASAYSTFANRGIRVDPVLVTRITKADGSVMYQNQHRQRKVLEPEVAFEESRILTGVITKGTGKTNADIGRPEAGKTGTVELKSGANSDAWFVGYTPDLATAVWVGYSQSIKGPDGRPVSPKDLGSVQGGKVPAQIWADFMKQALALTPPTPFTQPIPQQPQPTIPEVRQFEPLEPPDVVQMPDVRGRGQRDALARLEELGLVVTFRELLPNPQNQPGAVVNQSPLPGRTLTRGAEVSIEAAPGTQAVPSLLGLSATDAKQLLKQAGFEVAEAATAAPAGTVDATGAAVGPERSGARRPAPALRRRWPGPWRSGSSPPRQPNSPRPATTRPASPPPGAERRARRTVPTAPLVAGWRRDPARNRPERPRRRITGRPAGRRSTRQEAHRHGARHPRGARHRVDVGCGLQRVGIDRLGRPAQRHAVDQTGQRRLHRGGTIDTLPAASDAKTPQDRAASVEDSIDILTDMTDELAALEPPPDPTEASLVTAWLGDWDRHIEDRQRFVDVLESGRKDSQFTESLRDKKQVSRYIDRFARVNNMEECGTPGDI
jgi:membrane peptidoglycan carboxypeptidase